MESRDSIGRRRQPDQNRGLRPLFPRLPTTFASRAVRIAMTRPAWNRLDTLTAERAHETRPRALGEVIETLLAHFDTSSAVFQGSATGDFSFAASAISTSAVARVW